MAGHFPAESADSARGGAPRKVLIIEDDRDLSNLIAINLRDAGFLPEGAYDGRSGLERALSGGYALIILDVMLPALDGLEVCKGIRRANASIPILMLTAKSEELDKVLGLELGADDYLTKPFGIRELIARARALLRRSDGEARSSAPAASNDVIATGDITIDCLKRKVVVRGTVVELTAKEFDLLVLFARNPGRAFDRSQLLDLVWGYQYEGYDHTVNSHINRLRSKIEADPAKPTYLLTVWGVGYRFAESGELGGR